MINNDRVVPVMATDLLTLYGVILKQDSNNSSLEVLASKGIGEFEVAAASKVYLANEPVKTLNFGEDATSGTVFFVADYDYVGFTINGAATTPTGDVVADGNTLYKAVLATNAITITKVGL